MNANKKVAVYDNTVSARTYLSYISEQAGGFACIGRDGKLYIKTIGESISELPLKYFKDYSWGEKIKISRIRYEDGIQLFEAGDETGNTIYISQDNMYIVDQEQIDNIYNLYKDLEVYSFEGTSIIDPALDIGDLLLIDGKYVIYQGSCEYKGKWQASITSKIQCKSKEETTTRRLSQSTINRQVRSEINQIDGTIKQIVEENSETSQKLSEHTQTIDSMKDTISSVETSVATAQSTADEAQAIANANAIEIATTETRLSEAEQTIDGFTQRVSDVEETIVDMSVGARNWLKGSRDYSGATLAKTSDTATIIVSENAYNDCTSIHCNISTARTDYLDLIRWSGAVELKASTTYCLSFWAKGTMQVNVFLYPDAIASGVSSTKSTTSSKDGNIAIQLTNSWKRYWIKYKTLSDCSGVKNVLFRILAGQEGTANVAGVKFEEGSIATDWSPAPEDYSTTTEMTSVIEQKAEEINAEVTKKVGDDELGTKITQNYESVRLAWNKISEFIQFADAQLQIRGSDKNLLMTLDKLGQHFFNNNEIFGEMGVKTIDGSNYISFSVDGNYGESITDGMAWGVTINNGEFLPVLLLRDFTIPEGDSDGEHWGNLELAWCDLTVAGDISTGGITISGDPAGGAILFTDDSASDILYIRGKSIFGDMYISMLDDTIQFYKNSAGSNSFKIGTDKNKYCLFTDEGSIYGSSLSISDGTNSVTIDPNGEALGDFYFYSLPTYQGKKLVYGDNGHKYFLSWENSKLSFWVDSTNVTEKISDERLKTEIKNVDNELIKAIGELDYKQFRKDNSKDYISVGVIAQDLIEKLKEHGKNAEDYELLEKFKYKEDDDTKYYGINYNQFLLLRLMAKEQEIEELQNKDRQKDEMIKNLTSRVEALERSINESKNI